MNLRNEVKEMLRVRDESLRTKTCSPKPYGCGQPINDADFRDDLSRREAKISGLCQKCQDEFFGRDEDE